MATRTQQSSNSSSSDSNSDSDSSEMSLVDPRAPRFGQGVTATLLLAGVGTQRPALVYAVAVLLGIAVLSRWRIDLYALVWQHLLIPILGKPPEREPASPHRFAKLLGATGTIVASGFLLAGFSLLGFAVATAVGLLAALAAVSGLCLGCRMYRQVSFFRRHGIV
ncbi:DUF4395 domain-containing protein [Halobacteria archaeon AArc-m2/3/4]|uniref:DUF4395 domain-containing protein n=1 Tax=Natronoglomus mannanivorans TaxID=2979990 RepID=A0ABT2Q8W8_9EURY|nr:DUF4395 domain-containing protein [Halobacteria archaeon AArc-m2/3/4]